MRNKLLRPQGSGHCSAGVLQECPRLAALGSDQRGCRPPILLHRDRTTTARNQVRHRKAVGEARLAGRPDEHQAQARRLSQRYRLRKPAFGQIKQAHFPT